MSDKIENGPFIAYAENNQQCDDCGEIRKLRPYGPNGSTVCFKCAMKDEEGMKKRFLDILEGE